mmetsp:Transcript_10647/g.18405  ORF Transcript_10647/g.18405 Transcript_10647/m.18405 type:complete len:119 (+) Transcript_10647:1441-1797(+)
MTQAHKMPMAAQKNASMVEPSRIDVADMVAVAYMPESMKAMLSKNLVRVRWMLPTLSMLVRTPVTMQKADITMLHPTAMKGHVQERNHKVLAWEQAFLMSDLTFLLYSLRSTFGAQSF